MMADKAGKHSQLSVVSFDPRTKLYALLIFNIVMLTSLTEGVSVYLKPFLAILAFLFLLNARMTKTAVIYLVLYVVSWNAEFFLQYISGMSLGGFLIRFFSHMLTRIVPGFMFAYYMLRTTRVSEFIAAMKRMHISQKLIIPISIMFRFFPAVGDEYASIQDAMRLRGIGIRKGPIAMAEYRLVPLIISLVKIGDELSAAAVTRGLGRQNERSNYCTIGFKACDICLLLLMTGVFLVYLIC